MTQEIIGFTGQAGVGKTTIARMLSRHQWQSDIVSFAGSLKGALQILTMLPSQHFTDAKLKEMLIDGVGKSPRELMQLCGTEFVRKMVHPDFWVWRMHRVLADMREYELIMIDDVRFENEAALVRELGGTVVHLRRDFKSPTVHSGHESERSLRVMEGDIVIDSGNRGVSWTYANVHRKVAKI